MEIDGARRRMNFSQPTLDKIRIEVASASSDNVRPISTASEPVIDPSFRAAASDGKLSFGVAILYSRAPPTRTYATLLILLRPVNLGHIGDTDRFDRDDGGVMVAQCLDLSSACPRLVQ